MEKGNEKSLTTSFQKLHLSPISKSKPSVIPPTFQSSRSPIEKTKPPSLESLCLGVVGKHFEDIIEDLGEIAVNFPADTKMAMAAIARRRQLLNDDVIISLAEGSWEILDISGSDVSDFGLAKVAERCKVLRAVDISRCSKVTAAGVSELVWHCHSLETLRCGGCPRSDHTARQCLGIFKPKLNDIEGESWEELDPTEIAHGAESLRWLLWPKIDNNSLESFAAECPRIIVNPKPSPFGFRGVKVPVEALPNVALDEPIVKDIDPRTWAVSGFTARPTAPSSPSSTELPIAEKFRLAFVERDSRLAPKRAKNARQHPSLMTGDMPKPPIPQQISSLIDQVPDGIRKNATMIKIFQLNLCVKADRACERLAIVSCNGDILAWPYLTDLTRKVDVVALMTCQA